MHRVVVMVVSCSLAVACGGGSSGGPTGTPPGSTGGPGGTGGTGGPGGGAIATTSVVLSNQQFQPPAIIVAKGAVVTWTNSDNTAHDVTFATGGVASIPAWTSGQRTAAMPQASGTYGYRCTIHAGMSGTVQVE